MTPSAKEINNRTEHKDRSLTELCQEAVALLERARQHPKDLKEEVDQAERAVVRLRNRLIDRLREEGVSAQDSQIRPLLDQVNAALSLIVGVEYPSGGIHRKLLEQAHDTLQQLNNQGPLEQLTRGSGQDADTE